MAFGALLCLTVDSPPETHCRAQRDKDHKSRNFAVTLISLYEEAGKDRASAAKEEVME